MKRARGTLCALAALAGAVTPGLSQSAVSAEVKFRLPDLRIPIPGGGGADAAIGDVDGDGDLEIVAAANNLWAWHHDGTPMPNFPVGGRGLVVLADLDRDVDGDLEILYGGWSQPTGYVFAYHHTDGDGDGRADPVAGWPALVAEPFPIVASSYPSVEDLDGDGSPEVCFSVELYDFPRRHGSVYLFDAQGQVAPGAWPLFVADHSFRYNAGGYGDLDGDGELEFVLKAAQTPISNKQYLHVWDAAGATTAGFPAITTSGSGPESLSSAVLGDLTGDGVVDLVTGIKKEVVAVDSKGVELFRHDVGAVPVSTPALGDLDGDGALEVVVGVGIGGSFHVVVLNAAGNRVASTAQFQGRVNGNLSPLLGDLDGDGLQEILMPAQGWIPGRASKIHVFDRHGAWRPELTMFLVREPHMSQNAKLGDLDGDGDVEVVIAGDRNVYVWDFDGSPDDCDWPMFMHDPHLSGRLLP